MKANYPGLLLIIYFCWNFFFLAFDKILEWEFEREKHCVCHLRDIHSEKWPNLSFQLMSFSLGDPYFLIFRYI